MKVKTLKKILERFKDDDLVHITLRDHQAKGGEGEDFNYEITDARRDEDNDLTLYIEE